MLPHPAGVPEHQDIPVAVNERGDIAGYVVSGATGRGRDHHEVTISPPGVNSLGVAINDRGQVLSTDHSSMTNRWDPRTGRTTPLEGLSPAVTGRGMNNRGCAVGESLLPDWTVRATLLSPC